MNHTWSNGDIVMYDGRERLVVGVRDSGDLVLNGVPEDVPAGEVRLVDAAVPDLDNVGGEPR